MNQTLNEFVAVARLDGELSQLIRRFEATKLYIPDEHEIFSSGANFLSVA